MNVMTRAKKIARRLLRENRRGRTWREIAREDYDNKISHALLNKFALRQGEWLPNEEALIVLGLIKPVTSKPKRIFEMSPKELLWRLQNRS